MAELVVSDEGERYLLSRAIRDPWDTSETWLLHLYGNDYTPCKDTVEGDLEESDFPGYDTIVLNREDWTDPVTIMGVATSWNGVTPKLFEASSGSTLVYGYYITVPSAGVFLLSQRFDVTFLITSGQPLPIIPQLSLHSESEPTCPPPPPPPPP